MGPSNGEYTRYREFTDFREEMRIAVRDMHARVTGNEEAIKLEVAGAIRTMNKQLEAFRAEVQAERTARREDQHWHWSYAVSLFGTFAALAIAAATFVK